MEEEDTYLDLFLEPYSIQVSLAATSLKNQDLCWPWGVSLKCQIFLRGRLDPGPSVELGSSVR